MQPLTTLSLVNVEEERLQSVRKSSYRKDKERENSCGGWARKSGSWGSDSKTDI